MLTLFDSDKCYGKSKTSITPNLDSLIDRGTYFLQTISAAPVTIASVSSILTSLFPFKSIISDGSRFKLNSDVPTFISHLKDFGYNTTSITPEILSLSGLTNDFDHNVNYPGHHGLYDGVGKMILTEFEKIKLNKPWFFYIHLLDIHGPSRKFPKKFDDEKFRKKSI